MAVTATQIQEIQYLRTETSPTRRALAPGLEEVLFEPLPVLDHGFVRVIDYMGNDSSITQAARVSYGTGTKVVNQDKGLIDYLLRHHHTTPFEMCEIKFHIKLPIFVARQWIRHRTANVNEYSARYSILGKEFYIPDPAHLAVQSTTNRQGRGGVLPPQEAARVLELLTQDAEQAYAHYREMLNEDDDGTILDPSRSGLTRELARMNLTLNYYTEWYWKIDLHNLLHFLNLRGDSHAQYEIRAYAEVMLDLVQKWVPFTYDAFVKYRQKAVHLSAPAVVIVKKILKGQKIKKEETGMSVREWREFLEQLELEESSILAPEAI